MVHVIVGYSASHSAGYPASYSASYFEVVINRTTSCMRVR
jgi:hypothetical protein